MLLHEGPHRGGMGFEVEMQLLLRRQPRLAFIPQTPRQMQIFIRRLRRQAQIPGRTPQHPQAIDQAAQKKIRGGQAFSFTRRQDSGGLQSIQSLMDAWRP